MKSLLNFFMLAMIIVSCNMQEKQLSFIEKLNLYQINSIKVYNLCQVLLDTNDIILDCCTVSGVTPHRLIIPYNMVDSIYDRQKIDKYKNFILDYDALSSDSVSPYQFMNLRNALIFEFNNATKDTLYIQGRRSFQVNESIILNYKKKVKSIFHIQPIKDSIIKAYKPIFEISR